MWADVVIGGVQVCSTAKATPGKSSTAPASWCGIGARRARSGPSCSITSGLSNRETNNRRWRLLGRRKKRGKDKLKIPCGNRET